MAQHRKRLLYTVAMAAALACAGLFAFIPTARSVPETRQVPAHVLTHAQEVWAYALEWCESGGRLDAINERDLDGTPSYGPLEFKPATILYFGMRYGVIVQQAADAPDLYTLSDGSIGGITELVMDYGIQRAVLAEMIRHRDSIDWLQQFPDCVRRLGPPPAP